jgi:ribosomal protein S18 acetylase RimI-like enzyme
MRVEEAVVVDDELVDAFARLVPQLSRTAPSPGPFELEEMVASPSTALLLARDDSERIVGALTLVVFRIPTGVRAWIEDVVVDEQVRGGGVGTALVAAALWRAEEAGARTVDLTSRPDREAANRLYERMGFTRRATNVYRRTIERRADRSPEG